jgi:hypothetical protein
VTAVGFDNTIGLLASLALLAYLVLAMLNRRSSDMTVNGWL